MNTIQQYKQSVATAEEIMRKHIDEALEEIKETVGEKPKGFYVYRQCVAQHHNLGDRFPSRIMGKIKVELEF